MRVRHLIAVVLACALAWGGGAWMSGAFRSLARAAMWEGDALTDASRPSSCAAFPAAPVASADRYRQQGRLAEAEAELYRAFKQCSAAFGTESRASADVLASLGLVALERGDPGEAERFFAHSLAIVEKVLGPRDPRAIWNLIRLGSVFLESGHPERSELYLAHALAVLEDELRSDAKPSWLEWAAASWLGPEGGPARSLVGLRADALNEMASLWRRQGHPQRAMALLQRALDGGDELAAVERAILLSNLAAIDHEQDHSTEAERHLVDALQELGAEGEQETRIGRIVQQNLEAVQRSRSRRTGEFAWLGAGAPDARGRGRRPAPPAAGK